MPETITGWSATTFIWSHCTEEYLSTPQRRHTYGSFAEGKKLVAHRCVNWVVIQNCSGKMTFAGGDTLRACDTCVKAKRLYARLIDIHGEERKLGFYPLPDADRVRRHINDLRHWAVDD